MYLILGCIVMALIMSSVLFTCYDDNSIGIVTNLDRILLILFLCLPIIGQIGFIKILENTKNERKRIFGPL